MENRLIDNLDKLHTTDLGIKRIKFNLDFDGDIVKWCQTNIKKNNCVITRMGKNWYVEINNWLITINVYSYTIITAHMIRKKD